MLASISASNGGGYVAVEELSEALGAFLLRTKGGITGGPGNLVDSGNGDRQWWNYKGRRYATLWLTQYNGIHPVSVLHFDYYEDM